MASILTPEQTETLLALWERVIGQCDERRRKGMERERDSLLAECCKAGVSRSRARVWLSSLSRCVNTDDEEGVGDELLLQMAELRRALA